MVPVQAPGMVLGDVEAVAIALSGLDGNVRGVRVGGADGIEHVHLDVEAVQVEVGGVEIVRQVGLVDDHLGGVVDGFLVVLVFDLFSGLLQHAPVVVDRHVVRTQPSVGLVLVRLVGGQIVPQLDPEGLSRADFEGGSHEAMMIVGFGRVRSAAVDVIARFVPPGFNGLHGHGPDRGREFIVHITTGTGVGTGDVVGRFGRYEYGGRE